MAKAAKKAARGASPPQQEDPVYESIQGVDPDEKSHAKQMLQRIDRALTARKDFDTKVLPKLRQITYGIKVANASDVDEAGIFENGMGLVRTNLVFATQATLLPHIYARNPEIAVTPMESVGDGEYEQVKSFCETAQAMLNRCFVDETRLKQRMKASIRSTMTTSVGWLKLGWQESYRGDPMMVRRINDIQDNIARIEATASKLENSTDKEEQEALRAQLKQQEQAVLASEEITLYKGFVLDTCRTEDALILDEGVADFDDYSSASALAMRVYMSDTEYLARYGRKPFEGAKAYSAAVYSGNESETGEVSRTVKPHGGGDQECYRCVWEVWSLDDGRIYTLCEGANAYVRPPMTPSAMSKRWHSMFCLGFNLVNGRWRPISDVELLQALQDEYNHTRYLYAEARKEAIPVRIYRKGGELEDEDIEALAARKARRWYGVGGNPQNPINQDIMQLEGIAIDPNAYDVTLIRNDMDMMVGLSDASRANLIQAKTATEAQIMAQSLANRQSERQDTIEDLVSEMAEAALQIMLQKFTEAEVKEIVGEGAMWPEGAGPEIWHKIRVKVRAGSSGKPNQAKEREDWATVMPVLKEGMAQVSELRAAGQMDMANAVIELVKETLRRFDERIDVDRFIPRDAGQEGGEDGAQAAQMQQQVMQLQQQAMQLQEELQACQEELQKAQRQEQAKIADIQAKQAAAEQEANIRMQEAQMKAAVDLISRLGVVPGTHGVAGAMGELIDGASVAIQNVMSGKAALSAGGRKQPESAETGGSE